jgi:hypothetical protein
MRTLPVKFSSGPFADGCEPLFLISISLYPLGFDHDLERLALVQRRRLHDCCAHDIPPLLLWSWFVSV